MVKKIATTGRNLFLEIIISVFASVCACARNPSQAGVCGHIIVVKIICWVALIR